MSKKIAFVFSLMFCVNTINAQNKDILLTIDDTDVSASEFLKLYNKNIDLVKDESQKEIDNYLELFIDYKLKLKEARRLGLHESVNYKREFENYKKQLTKNYLTDNEVTDALVKEAYDRSVYDIKASHILILNNPKEQDTLVAYKKLLEYRTILKEDGFNAAKAKLHDGKTVLVEDLGYFSAFKMVYDFESKAYETEPGKVSMPFKTQFGYHVVKVDEKRPSRGTVTVAHIFISDKQKDSTINTKDRINDIYTKVLHGESFESLAKQFSDDKSSARSGGKLRPFKSGNLSSIAFEDVAFSLNKVGEISKPVKTQFGWHIIKLIKKEPVPSFVDQKSALEAQVKRDSRSKLINSAMVKKLEGRYNISKNPETKAYFNSILKEGYLSGTFNLPKDYNGEIYVFKVNDSVFTNNDFFQHLKSQQRKYMRQKTTVQKVLTTEYKTFYENAMLKFREDNLVNENEEFVDILKEYKDGLLLFALMEQEIWNKASKDSLGLQKYYEANKTNYVWEDRIRGTIISSGSIEDLEQLATMLKAGDSIPTVKEQLKKEGVDKYIFTSGTFEKSNTKIPVALEFKIGTSKVYEHNGGYHLFNVDEVLPVAPKTLEEIRGIVVNDYQEKIEKDWLKELRNRFKYSVNKKVLKRLKRKMKS